MFERKRQLFFPKSDFIGYSPGPNYRSFYDLLYTLPLMVNGHLLIILVQTLY